ncbi:CPBP family intramembrane glutamic endopeptidase [Microbacterium sp. NPDC058389]|uniref:CPBP family intramembrane glutamic endopeptidase n=1 Tax=Microbacterium sp. NPDC058389 TaxID=3346475 RepID=UPI00365E038B
MTTNPQYAPRIAPRVWLGVLGYLIYLAAFFTVWILNGIDYLHIGDDESTLWRWYVAPLAVGSVAIVAIVSFYGWWRPALFEDGNRVSPKVWILPGLLAAAAVANLIFGDTSHLTGGMWVLLTIGSLLVGFNEELVTRGQLIVALRSRFGERGVWFFSTLLFALLHLPNTLFGTGPVGLLQVLFTFLAGSVFYLTRRAGGTLIFAMLLHALWDFSTFAAITAITAYAQIGVGVAGVIVALVVTRRSGQTATSTGAGTART